MLKKLQLCKSTKRLSASDRGLGLDFWAPAEMLLLEEQHFAGLAEIMNFSESRLAPPLRTLLSLIALIGKPTGGDRPICLSSLFYVIWSSIRNRDINAWEDGYIRFWDDAVRGSSALRASLMRRLLGELHFSEKISLLQSVGTLRSSTIQVH